MKLGVLLERLFAALPDLAAAITMRCGSTDPARAGVVGVRGEKVVVVEGLNDKRYVRFLTVVGANVVLFFLCCSSFCFYYCGSFRGESLSETEPVLGPNIGLLFTCRQASFSA